MSSAASNEVPLSKSTRERLERMALSMGMTGDEFASAYVEAVADAIVKASQGVTATPSNVVPFPRKR